MSKEIYISSTPHETRLAIVENDDLAEIYYERENEYTLAGSIYNGKVTRVLPGMQSSFVDIGLERDAFLYITDFMEEAGDSADFDAADGRSGSRRGSHDDHGGSRENGTSRVDTAVSRDPATDATDRSSTPSTEGREGRGDRDGGRRRRGGRDNRNDRAPRDRQSETRSALPVDEPLDIPPVIDSGYIEPGSDAASADLGHGAPGADGSRRWRGRRGRRRGRSAIQREESQVLQGDGGESPSGSTADQANRDDVDRNDEPEENFVEEYNDSFDLDASATPQATSAASQGDRPAPSSSEQDAAASIEDRRPRDRDRGRRDRGGRDRDGRSPRTPRGFSPSRSLYGVDATPETEAADAGEVTPEPFVLPGESLSKYRKDAEASASASTESGSLSAASSPHPAVADFTLPGAWDGGNVLPGETIRPRSNSGSSPDRSGSESSSESRGSRDRGDRGNRRGGRDGRDDRSSSRRDIRENRPHAGTQTVAASAVSLRNEPPVTDTLPGHTLEYSASTSSSATEEPQRSSEYEPTDASASVRFDPATRREFRQSAPVAEPLDVPAHQEADTTADHAHESLHADDVQSTAHTITPQPETSLEPIHLSAAVDPNPGHEFTSISNTGEMLSDMPLPPHQQEVQEPASPLQHEAAVSEAPVLPTSSPEPPPQSAVEETFEDEEDFNATTLHASSIEEMDYDDEDSEETLEVAADLGGLIREMTIDQITRPSASLEEDDILEEEDAVEDHYAHDGDTDEDDEDDESFEGESTSTERDTLRSAEAGIQEHGADRAAGSESPANGFDVTSDPERRSSRREAGRRDGRRGERGRDRGMDRARSTGGSGDRSTSRPGRRDGRHSAQTTNLPAISDLLKPGQEVLVQIAKEPIAKKGARITSHIALPGRFLVFMPTVNHTGVSRKIESDGERRRLKEILLSEKGEALGGFIVRTAASGASEEELRSDLRFLLNLWADIKQRSESSKSPALIYHDLNLVERILRDQVTDNFSAIWVDTETEYERVLRFLQRFQPSLIRRVKLYTKEAPLFEQFGITEEINKALRSKVWLKSGGSIVINQTEALVAIDINTGKYVGKTARLEDTIVKTNLDAIPEIVRQIRLRDLGGIIIIDFIDMDERKNRHKVMTALEEELKKDRAPSKVLQFNDFGLVAITRKRVKQSLERTLSTTCNICVGTGMVKSAVTVCNDIYIEMRKMQKHLDRGDVMLRVNPEVVKQLKSPGTKWLQEMEEMVGKTILVKSDPSLHPEQFDIH